MKKNRVLLSFLIFAIGCLSFSSMAYTRDELSSIARKASLAAAKTAMATVSPNTGMDPDYDVDYESIKYDSYAKELEFQVTLSWSAKNQMLFGTRDICKVWGKIYVDLSGGKSEMKSRFICKEKNHWTEVCENSHGIDAFAKALWFISTN